MIGICRQLDQPQTTFFSEEYRHQSATHELQIGTDRALLVVTCYADHKVRCRPMAAQMDETGNRGVTPTEMHNVAVCLKLHIYEATYL